jgi:methionine-rich copper-binding protein CopC
MHAARISTFLSLVLLTACDPPRLGDQKITNVQENSAPTGFVAGRILAAADGTPIAGATITTFADGVTTTSTDASGLYRLGPLAAGSYTVFFEAPGYLKRFVDVSIGSPNSMFPVGNSVVTLDLDLSHPDAKVQGLVLTSTGRIAQGAKLFLDLRPIGFDLVMSTTADASGRFEFAGLPGAAFGQTMTVQVAPFDENGDELPDYNAAARSFTLFPGFTTYNTISLVALGVQLVTSNVSDAELQPSEAITLTFSGQLRPNLSTVTLFRNAGGVQVGASLSWDPTNTIATLTPVGGTLVEGQLYYVSYTVRAVNGASTTNSINFTVRAATGTPPLGTVTGFRVAAPLATDSSLSSATLAWNALDEAGGYRIYGKDSAMGSAYLLLSSLSSGLSTGATVNLNLFDSIAGDGFTTPLGHHNAVRLAIVATDRAGNEAPFSTAATLELVDGVAPTVFSGVQSSGSANNLSGGTPATVQYQVIFSEMMLFDTPPNLTLPNAATSAVWAWTTPNRGLYTITIPAGIDGRGALSVTGAIDTSDNVQSTAFEGVLQ